MVQRDEPVSPFLPGDVVRSGSELVGDSGRGSSISTLTFIGLFVLFVLAAFFVWMHFAAPKTEQRQPTIEPAVREASAPPARPTPAARAAGNIVPVFPDMVKVTSVALGKTPLAIVNGKRVAEGDSLEIKTERGVATLVVDKIEEGAVHFRNGDIPIESKLVPRYTPKPLQ